MYPGVFYTFNNSGKFTKYDVVHFLYEMVGKMVKYTF
jgi:hypothetical protein